MHYPHTSLVQVYEDLQLLIMILHLHVECYFYFQRKHPEIKLNLSRTPVLQDYPIDKMGRIVVMPQIQKIFPKSTPVEGNVRITIIN